MRPIANLVLCSRQGKKTEGNKTELKELKSDWTNLSSVMLKNYIWIVSLPRGRFVTAQDFLQRYWFTN